MSTDYQKILEQTLICCQEAAAFISVESKNFDKEQVQSKAMNQLVSYVDKEAEKILVSGLTTIMPEAGFMTEEDTIENELKEYTWVIDPLDGTTNFVHSIPFFAVSVALTKNNRPVVGVIIHVNVNDVFYATNGGGAFLNGEKIELQPKLLKYCMIATGFPFHSFEELEQYMKIFGSLMNHCRGIRRMGSAALDLAYVAAGRFDGFFEYNLNWWDIAAGMLMVQEAGGEVSDFSGNELVLNAKEVLAGSRSFNQELRDLIDNSIDN